VYDVLKMLVMILIIRFQQ